jgi:5-methylcytosine-specific restriction endonuclease McrA
MSEDAAYKRIAVARTARRFPAIFPMLGDGRLNQTAVLLLAPHLTPNTVDELLTAATHKTKPEVEQLLAQRFPQPDVPTLLQPIERAAAGGERMALSCGVPEAQLAPERVVPSADANSKVSMVPLAPAVPTRAKTTPLSPGRFALQLTMGQVTHDLLREAQSLLGHAVGSVDVEAVLERALRELVERLKRRKFGACARPRPQRAGTGNRYIPAEVRRGVSSRDGGQCTFVSESGRRCEERKCLEFDHIQSVARGGRSTVANLRLRCRAHNLYAAERVFGAGFMRGKQMPGQAEPERSRPRPVPVGSSPA